MSKNLAIIGVPTNLGANNLGANLGPDGFRGKDLIAKLSSVGLAVTDYGNVACKERKDAARGSHSRLRYRDEIVATSLQTATVVHKAVQAKAHPTVLGGDHSVLLGAFAGAATSVDEPIGLIYFDAHGDMNTHETTPSGNIHGMQLAALMGFGDEALVNVVRPGAKVKPEHVLHIGGSDLDQAEKDLIAQHNIRTYTMLDIVKHSFGPLFPLIDELRSKVKHIWVSLDLDSIDALYAPAASMPNKKGLLYREVTALTQYIGETCDVLGMDVVEYNPLQDEQGKTAELAIELISQLYGENYDWYSDYMRRNRSEL